MQHLSKLLEIEDSQLAWVLRLGLHGLRTQLQEALKEAKTDSGQSSCQELVRELDQLLQPQKLEVITPPTPPTWEEVFEPIHLELSGEQKLKHIADALLADQELLQHIGAYKFHSNNDVDLWNEIQRLLLRVPEKLAHTWRECILAEASQLGALEDKLAVQQFGFSRNEHVYSGLQGSVYATGLCLSDQVGFDPRLQVETRGGELDLLAGIVSVCLKFIDIDTCLHHALKSVDRFGVRSLNSESEKSKYVTALLDRFQRVLITTDADPAIALRARLDLDEAIHSLVYLPPCDRFSWWGKLQQEARRTLDSVVEKARDAGYQVQIRPLWGTYADIYTWSKDDLQLNIGGVPGEVSACLRVCAKINDEVIPGRVLFRSSSEA
ncbi:hypothetical protein [Fischerella thermalis]|uniref:Uncharacterized protein n=1 Tax=Fischerella thermalis JSC-11 TaxID=741277 RepID=G6FN98_9CYAN|nr:hypothetical protein [Fischerella thermalis]PMB10221.1 hypothetical protein CI592_05045 [Fischerella thermalis CCMEE 5328]EHC19528.1 hypothetical protein FJSC11DRAFT_0345 [Fischerella thermalis JSC-11]PLZ09128.1 hypothetical protein CBP17_14955 [Fischerella thermalis WC114]PLZ11019.1 hypothetical protein CBP19_13455 [Fischerella thermalis WC1110]PLZ12095.1 hypothetical protein CBP18_07230 [Fischerella thermalis WC119]